MLLTKTCYCSRLYGILILYLWKVTIIFSYENHWTFFHHSIKLLSLIMYAKKIRALLENCTFFFFILLQKKHCAHSVTSDVSIGETASAASFFLSDGLIVTGTHCAFSSNLFHGQITQKHISSLTKEMSCTD